MSGEEGDLLEQQGCHVDECLGGHRCACNVSYSAVPCEIVGDGLQGGCLHLVYHLCRSDERMITIRYGTLIVTSLLNLLQCNTQLSDMHKGTMYALKFTAIGGNG